MRILTAALFAMLSSTVSMAQEPIKLSDADRQQIVSQVIEHFRQNPQELVESILKWREGQPTAAAKSDDAARSDRLPDPVSGRRDAPISIIEFSDYGCTPCNGVSAVLDELARQDPDIRIIHRDSPRSSIEATAASIDLIAAASKGGRLDLMRNIYLREGVQPETRIKALAASGVKVENADRKKATRTMEVSTGLAKRAGVVELPAIIVVVGNKVQALSGSQTKASILEAVATVSRAAAEQMAQ
ncbi:thioredoxin domain-containing protein [Agrobacterium rubi]|nr:thioredoxin domain-containing protein [Agrobacterium rubi]NTF24378.1 thioredoxin domain-containing protein [Agrobacterium rubi]